MLSSSACTISNDPGFVPDLQLIWAQMLSYTKCNRTCRTLIGLYCSRYGSYSRCLAFQKCIWNWSCKHQHQLHIRIVMYLDTTIVVQQHCMSDASAPLQWSQAHPQPHKWTSTTGPQISGLRLFEGKQLALAAWVEWSPVSEEKKRLLQAACRGSVTSSTSQSWGFLAKTRALYAVPEAKTSFDPKTEVLLHRAEPVDGRGRNGRHARQAHLLKALPLGHWLHLVSCNVLYGEPHYSAVRRSTNKSCRKRKLVHLTLDATKQFCKNCWGHPGRGAMKSSNAMPFALLQHRQATHFASQNYSAHHSPLQIGKDCKVSSMIHEDEMVSVP